MNTCNGCGKVDHAGGCDLVDFYYYQRWARVNPGATEQEIRQGQVGPHVPEKIDPPSPPGERLIDRPTPLKEPPPLVQQTDISVVPRETIRKARRGPELISAKVKKADTPEIIAHREKVRQARVKRMAYARKVRAEKNANA